MPTDDPDDNRRYCKAYYERVKQDPAKLAALRSRRARNQQRRRQGRDASVDGPSAPSPVAVHGESAEANDAVSLSLESLIATWLP